MVKQKRDYVLYELRKGREIVYFGITNEPDRREVEHKQDKDFTSMNVITPKLTLESAKKREAERVETYKSNHGGKPPKYNKQK